MMSCYWAKIKKNAADGCFYVGFPQFPDIHTDGMTLYEAKKNAGEALNGVMSVVIDIEKPLPTPRQFKGPGMYAIEIEPQILTAMALRRLRGRASQKHVASKLNISYQAYQKLENPRTSNPTVKTLSKVVHAFGKRIEIGMVEAV